MQDYLLFIGRQPQEKKVRSAEPSARLINYCSVWVSAIATVTARFPSLWVGLFDLCDLPGGRPVIQWLACCRKVYKLRSFIVLTSCTGVTCLFYPGLFCGIVSNA